MFLLKGRTILIFTLLLVGLSSCRSRKESILQKKYSPEQLKQDATLFRDVVLKMHPVIGIYKPRAYYEGLFDQFIGQIKDSLTEKEFRFKLKMLAEGFLCGHTEVIASRRSFREMGRLRQNFSPFIFVPIGEKVYMLASASKKQDSILKKGIEVTRINGVEVDSMLRHCKRFLTSDGYNTSSKDYYVMLGFNVYYQSIFGRPDTFEVEAKTETGMKTQRYPALKVRSLPPVPLGPKDDSLFVRYKKAAMKYRYLDKGKQTMLLKIDKFSHRKDAKAYRRLFRKMRMNKTSNLVLDLRGNGGGSLANSYRLLSYLVNEEVPQTLSTGIRRYPYRKYTGGDMWFRFTRVVYKLIGEKKTVHDTDYFTYRIKPRKKNHFNGRVLVLINGGSFSASSLVSAYLYYKGRAQFIGTETGGTREGCNAGITPYYVLPNTHLKARIPAFRIVHDVDQRITGRGVMPDYPIRYGITDILQKRDLELMKAKELLNIE